VILEKKTRSEGKNQEEIERVSTVTGVRNNHANFLQICIQAAGGGIRKFS